MVPQSSLPTRDYQGLRGTTRDYERLLATTKDCEGLLESTRDYEDLRRTTNNCVVCQSVSGASLRAMRAMALSRTVDADTKFFYMAAEPEVADSESMPSSWMGAAGDASQHPSGTRWKRCSGIAPREPLQQQQQQQQADPANDIPGGATAGSHDPPARNLYMAS